MGREEERQLISEREAVVLVKVGVESILLSEELDSQFDIRRIVYEIRRHCVVWSTSSHYLRLHVKL